MNILVTGGMGFIGSHLIDRLLAEGNHVHVVDNLSTSPIPLNQLLSEMGHPANLTYDIKPISLYFNDWMDQREAPCFDQIYHLASPVGPAGILQYAGRMVKMINDDTDDLIVMAIECNARLLDVSTSEVYGGGVGGLCREDMPRVIQAHTTVRLEYAVAKLAAETALINTVRTTPLNAVIVRPFNVAGRRQSGEGGFVLPRFIRQAMNDQEITVFGDGSQMRAFTHVSDIVDGLIRAMELGKSGEVYNLGNPQNRITIMDLAQKVRSVIGGGRITLTDGRAIYGDLYAEAADKFPHHYKAATELHWKPTWGIDAIIRDAWEYERQKVATT